jgi:hypothetical protein
MKALLTSFVIFSAVSVCQFARSQSESGIQILQATYGAESGQMDVTDKVQSLVQSGQQPNVKNDLFGKDPASGKSKTLSVDYSVNGVQYHNDIRENQQLSLQPVNQVDTASQPSATSGRLSAPSLAPDGTYVLIGSMHIVKNGALIGLHSGTVVQAVRDNGNTLHVTWEDSEFDIDKRIVTNDLNVAQAAVRNDQQGQAKVASWMTQQQDAINKRVEHDNEKAREEVSRLMGSPREGGNQTAAKEAHRNRPPVHHTTRGLSPGWDAPGLGSKDDTFNNYKRQQERLSSSNRVLPNSAGVSSSFPNNSSALGDEAVRRLKRAARQPSEESRRETEAQFRYLKSRNNPNP